MAVQVRKAHERTLALLAGALIDLARLRSARLGRPAPKAERLSARIAHAILDRMGRL